MKTQAITLIKEEVLSLGRLVGSSVAELTKLLMQTPSASLELIEQQEKKINELTVNIEEKCLDLLHENQDLNAKEIRTLLGSTQIAAKFERLADHAHRIARLISWSHTAPNQMPAEFSEMAGVVNRMVEDVLLCFLTDNIDRVPEIMQRDSRIDYLHDVVSKNLLLQLGEQDQEHAQTGTQLLFCARYLERMGDCCTSIAKRIHFIVTGERLISS